MKKNEIVKKRKVIILIERDKERERKKVGEREYHKGWQIRRERRERENKRCLSMKKKTHEERKNVKT